MSRSQQIPFPAIITTAALAAGIGGITAASAGASVTASAPGTFYHD